MWSLLAFPCTSFAFVSAATPYRPVAAISGFDVAAPVARSGRGGQGAATVACRPRQFAGSGHPVQSEKRRARGCAETWLDCCPMHSPRRSRTPAISVPRAPVARVMLLSASDHGSAQSTQRPIAARRPMGASYAPWAMSRHPRSQASKAMGGGVGLPPARPHARPIHSNDSAPPRASAGEGG